MTDPNSIENLLAKLELLLQRQESFGREINVLREEINRLKNIDKNVAENTVREEKKVGVLYQSTSEKSSTIPMEKLQVPIPPIQESFMKTPPQTKSDLEKFIGENLISKIGIAITIIGVVIGAKYSIEHQLISPLTRIVLGYIVALGLLGFGIKLKKDYDKYSAVLVSGAIAIMYFITYAAYSLYGLFPQTVAFAMMVIFTAFAVVAAISYSMQVIAHIGLVGAYAIPFLLSNGSGKVVILFSYMALINIGITIIAFKKYWKSLYFVSFIFTWLIFLTWYVNEYEREKHFTIALSFLAVFYVSFYLIFLGYKLIQKEKYQTTDIVLLLFNSFLFYGIGYAVIHSHASGKQFLGLFTVGNALIHFAVSLVLYKQKLADRNLFYLIAGLVLVFITIAVPVQLDGDKVTLLWAFEAVLLFWIGRTKAVAAYEKLSYPLIVLAFISILHDWLTGYNDYIPEFPASRLTALLNIHFFSSLLVAGAFGSITFLSRSTKYVSAIDDRNLLKTIFSYLIPALLLVVLYYAFAMEIWCYWDQLYTDSIVPIKVTTDELPDSLWNTDLLRFQSIWIINYSIVFLSVLSLLNIYKIKNNALSYVSMLLNLFALVIFLTKGLYLLSELRESYLHPVNDGHYSISTMHLWIRYVSIAIAGFLVLSIRRYMLRFLESNDLVDTKVAFDLILHITLIWVASSELIHWLDLSGTPKLYRLGLSILWGSYALLLIIIGIAQRKAHLRIGAIVLFTVTLIKLFFYDIKDLNTISKTIVFVALGVLLLIISFLYNKYKHRIADEGPQ